jgi:REP element-mobilizing transposase RayT
MPQSYASLHCHFIFSTKHRLPLITADIQPRLFEYLGGIFRASGSVLIKAGGMPDHVHLLASLPRDLSVADVMRLVKTNSSGWLHDTFPGLEDFAWQAGYGAFAVSYSQVKTVQRYINRQADHHRKRTFQEEFLEFLQRHDIAYDERYLWD